MTDHTATNGNDATFYAMTRTLSAEADFAAQIDKVLSDLIAAESWESMAVRAAGRSQQHQQRDLVPVPVRRRAA